MTARTSCHRLQVATPLYDFIEQQVLPGTGVASAEFWKGFDAIVHDLGPKNVALLAERDRIQTEMDAWHRAHPGPIQDMPAYKAFLTKIGYLVAVPANARATTTNVDAELALQAGPRSRPERTLCTKCCECALGLFVRRPVRHRRHLRG